MLETELLTITKTLVKYKTAVENLTKIYKEKQGIPEDFDIMRFMNAKDDPETILQNILDFKESELNVENPVSVGSDNAAKNGDESKEKPKKRRRLRW